MEEQSNQETPVEKFHTQHHGAHSGTRAGISDYNDGGNLSHYGGNDDTYQLSDQDDEEKDSFDGSVAFGNENEFDEEENDKEDHGKAHSGL